MERMDDRLNFLKFQSRCFLIAVDHRYSAALFAETPHGALSIGAGSTSDTKFRYLWAASSVDINGHRQETKAHISLRTTALYGTCIKIDVPMVAKTTGGLKKTRMTIRWLIHIMWVTVRIRFHTAISVQERQRIDVKTRIRCCWRK